MALQVGFEVRAVALEVVGSARQERLGAGMSVFEGQVECRCGFGLTLQASPAAAKVFHALGEFGAPSLPRFSWRCTLRGGKIRRW